METIASKEDKLTLKSLQNHLIKTVLGALAVTLVGAFITSYAFHINTNNNLDELNKNKSETKADIRELKNDVAEIKTSLSNTNIYTVSNKEKAQSLENQISEIKKQQDEMVKLLYEIKSKVK